MLTKFLNTFLHVPASGGIPLAIGVSSKQKCAGFLQRTLYIHTTINSESA